MRLAKLSMYFDFAALFVCAGLAPLGVANTTTCTASLDKVFADGIALRSGAFSGSVLYYLGESKQGRLALYKLQTAGDQGEAVALEPVLSMGGSGGQPLVLHGVEGEPVRALSTISSVCPRPEGNQRLTISLEKAHVKEAVQKQRGFWTVIPGYPAAAVFDLQKMDVVETDPLTLQTRAALKVGGSGAMFTQNEWPLYYDASQRRIYTWRETSVTKNSQPRGVTRWRVSSGAKKDGGFVAEAKFVLGPEERVAFSAGVTQAKMAAVSFDAATNDVVVREAPGWSGESISAARYKFVLPKSYAAKDSAVNLSIEKNLAVVTPLTSMAKHRWRRLFIYNYKTGKQIRAVNIEPGLQVGAVMMHADGTRAAAELTKNGSFVGIIWMDLESGESQLATISTGAGAMPRNVKPSPSASLKGS